MTRILMTAMTLLTFSLLSTIPQDPMLTIPSGTTSQSVIPTPAPHLTMEEQLRLQLLVEHQYRIKAEYDGKLAEFKLRPDVKQLLDQMDVTQRNTRDLVTELFTKYSVDSKSWDINVATGEFHAKKAEQ